MRKIATKGLLAAAVAVGLSLSIATPSLADDAGTDTLSSADQASLEQKLLDSGVASSDIDTLLQKLDDGVPWDVFIGAEPATTETSRSGNVVTIVERFDDGSVATTTYDDPPFRTQKPGLIQPMATGTSGCVMTAGNTYYASYTGCYSKVELTGITMGFHYDKTVYPGATGKITSYYDYQYSLWGGALSDHKLTRVSSSTVKYSADGEVTWGGVTIFNGLCWMQVALGKSYVETITHN